MIVILSHCAISRGFAARYGVEHPYKMPFEAPDANTREHTASSVFQQKDKPNRKMHAKRIGNSVFNKKQN
ncbi:hypothetical protein ACFL1R_12920 [Candidatus Latescibacterota bacterium]